MDKEDSQGRGLKERLSTGSSLVRALYYVDVFSIMSKNLAKDR